MKAIRPDVKVIGVEADDAAGTVCSFCCEYIQIPNEFETANYSIIP